MTNSSNFSNFSNEEEHLDQALLRGVNAMPVLLGSGIVVGILGKGGMAKVYKTWNENLEVNKAVKLLLPSKKMEFESRFKTELKITAQLRHPNIVEIHSGGEWNGLPYIEMEFVDGQTLSTVITKKKSLPPIVACAIGIHVAKALAYAHEKNYTLYNDLYTGVIHRDLKPANIIISKNGYAKLMDFGVARPSEVGLHTKTGCFVGTLPYLAPEHFYDETIDARSDIYSFGAILYEMISGQKAFPQSNIENLIRMKATSAYKSIKSFDTSIDSNYIKIIDKCMAKKEKRYEKITDTLSDLESYYSSCTDIATEKLIQEYITKNSVSDIKISSRKLNISSNIQTLFHYFYYGLISIGKMLYIYTIKPLEKIKPLYIYGFFTLLLIGILSFFTVKYLDNKDTIDQFTTTETLSPVKTKRSHWNDNKWGELIFE